MSKDLQELNDILFEQLTTLTQLNIKDENFEKEKDKANLICETADRIIKNSELELRNQVWQSTRKYKLTTRPTVLGIGCREDYGNAE